jgi:hypothetical protein
MLAGRLAFRRRRRGRRRLSSIVLNEGPSSTDVHRGCGWEHCCTANRTKRFNVGGHNNSGFLSASVIEREPGEFDIDGAGQVGG